MSVTRKPVIRLAWVKDQKGHISLTHESAVSPYANKAIICSSQASYHAQLLTHFLAGMRHIFHNRHPRHALLPRAVHAAAAVARAVASPSLVGRHHVYSVGRHVCM